MEDLKRWLTGVISGERGQDFVEYVLIATVISGAIVLAAQALTSAVDGWAEQIASLIVRG